MRYGVIVDIETTGYLRKKNRYVYADGSVIPDEELSKIPIEQRYMYSSYEVLEDSSEILSVGYAKMDLDTMQVFDAGVLYFYKPYFQVESSAQDVHHLQRSFLQQFEDSFDDNLATLEAMLINAVIIGKNSNINTQNMKNYDKKKLILSNEAIPYDVQTKFAPIYRGLMEKVKGVILSDKKKGSLEDYIHLLDEDKRKTLAVVEEFKALTSDQFEVREHDALYDVAMTTVVFRFLQKIANRS